MLWGSIGLIAFVYSLSAMTTYTYLAFATSSFDTHALLGTISVIVSIMAGVTQPFIAKVSGYLLLHRPSQLTCSKVADLTSRPVAIALSVFFYAIGYIVVAASKSVTNVAGGKSQLTLQVHRFDR
jgi:hypothetical protein